MMKSLLIGFGSFVAIGVLVWMGSQTTMPEERVAAAQKQLETEDGRVKSSDRVSSVYTKIMANRFLRGEAKTYVENPFRDKMAATERVASARLLPTLSGCEELAEEPCDRVNPTAQTARVVLAENLAPGSRSQDQREPLTHADFKMPLSTSSYTERVEKSVMSNLEEDLAESSRSLEEVWTHAIKAEPIAAAREQLLSNGRQDGPRHEISTRPFGISQMNVVEKQTASDQKQLATEPNSQDEGYRWDEIGIRGGFNTKYVAIPPTEKENFEQFDLFGAVRFPKQYYYESGWEIYFRMNGSVGALRGNGKLGFLATISPGIVFWYPAWNISINGGPGFAYVSREKYGRQDLGGPIQIVGQGGLTYYVTNHIGIGWRFHHISDAGIWGSNNRGVDANLFELTYKF